MLYEEVDEPADISPVELRERYVAELAGIIEARGVDAVADESGVDREAVARLADGDAEGVTLEEAAAIAALADDAPAKEDVVAEARDSLLLGMTTAVLDVDAIAADLDADLDAKQVQQKIEGRAPMTLDEYARLRHFIASRKQSRDF